MLPLRIGFVARNDDLTPKILEKIHREIQKTNQTLDETKTGLERSLGELREDTSRRLDLLTQAATRTNTELLAVKTEVAAVKTEVAAVKTTLSRIDKTVERNGRRFERALVTQGGSHRELEARVARLERHAGLEP